MSAYIFWQLTLADFRQRARRYSFFVMLAALCYFGYLTISGRFGLWVNGYQGVRNSAWVAAVMALVANTLMGLCGFYFVKGTISRDAETGVGQILAATRVSRFLYIFSKVASNFTIFGTMLALFVAFAGLMQIAFGDGHPLNLWQLASPFLLFSLPCLFVYSACAVLFDCVPLLRSGIGNIVFFFLWNGVLALSILGGIDFTGIVTLGSRMQSIVHAIDPNAKTGISLGTMTPTHVLHFVWNGLPWTFQLVAQRMIWVLVGFAISGIAAILFSRFDPSTRPSKWTFSKSLHAEEAPPQQLPASRTMASSLSPPRSNDGILAQWIALTRIELCMLLPQHAKKLWLLVAAALTVAEALSPLDAARHEVLAVAWIWPLLAWSKMGARQGDSSADKVLMATSGYVRQLFACWTAGALLAAASGAPIFVRLAFHHMWLPALGWLTAVAFIPAMALAFGSISQTPKLFEVIYLALWYAGPLHRISALDFTGASGTPTLLASYAALTTFLFSMASLWRIRIAYPRVLRFSTAAKSN